LTVVVSLATITFVTPWFGVALVPILYIYAKILNYFREVSRETKRLESISRSPVFAHFSETLGGLGTISAYNQASRFIDNFEIKVDANTRGTYNNRAADRWLSVRLELLGSLVAGLAAVFACSVVINNSASAAGSSSNFASVAGLSLNYAISVTSLLQWVVRSFATMESSMTSAERIFFYSEEIPQEAPFRSNELKALADSSDDKNNDKNIPAVIATKAKGGIERIKTDVNWPSNGKVTLKNLKMRYRAETPLVLKGLDVEIEGGSRVGVVGRTGSGKSSLLLTLLRIVEPSIGEDDSDEEYEAPISIDGVDILRIGLTDLRETIGIIPQNPVLFSGTIRSNMDPFNNHTEEEIWNSLDGCGMKSTIENMPALLDAPVAEYGDNLSQGQRQLLCLGRALLKKCHILLLDEATSSVDYETDQEIQRTLREAFVGCTVLTIAHRVNTILDSDKILVMVDGKVGEFASPKELLADDGSIFSDIVRHSKTESN
jgi:ABC-type multidrug transport system fused ATPase/permease subunit